MPLLKKKVNLMKVMKLVEKVVSDLFKKELCYEKTF